MSNVRNIHFRSLNKSESLSHSFTLNEMDHEKPLSIYKSKRHTEPRHHPSTNQRFHLNPNLPSYATYPKPTDAKVIMINGLESSPNNQRLILVGIVHYLRCI